MWMPFLPVQMVKQLFELSFNLTVNLNLKKPREVGAFLF